MITNMTEQMVNAIPRPCAQIQGASSLTHVATVVLMAFGFAPVQGAAVGDAKYGGQGSRAWSPPV